MGSLLELGMLSHSLVERILARLPSLTLGVVGDLFLDQYLHLDARLTEPSLETGLDAYQVTHVVNAPGAAGTVLNNLAALGVGKIKILSLVGKDGRGFDLKKELRQRKLDLKYLIESPLRHTPTYSKPLLVSRHSAGSSSEMPRGEDFRELNRLDFKNRTPTPLAIERKILKTLPALWSECNALLVMDQVSETDCGVITAAVREKLSELGEVEPTKLLLADSRERIGQFRSCWTKPNLQECRQAIGNEQAGLPDPSWAVLRLALITGRPVFCTRGAEGILLADPSAPSGDAINSSGPQLIDVPGFPVSGPIDPVGAGDSTSAGIACAYAAGASLAESAAFGNLIASVTVQQLGTTGVATPELVRQQLHKVMPVEN